MYIFKRTYTLRLKKKPQLLYSTGNIVNVL